MENILNALQSQPFAVAISESSWLFPTLETLHVFALVLVFGSIALVDLRLLGLASMDRRAGDLIDRVLPGTWAAFALAALTGALLFTSNATTYYENIPFRMKMVLLLLAALNMALFHFGAHRRIAEWDEAPSPPAAARIAGLLSLLLWTGVIFAGRWIGFTL